MCFVVFGRLGECGVGFGFEFLCLWECFLSFSVVICRVGVMVYFLKGFLRGCSGGNEFFIVWSIVGVW